MSSKPMTNYNERLDETGTLRKIIRENMFASEKWDGDEQFGYYTGGGPDEHFVSIDENWLEAALNDTEAAITSLIKELVAEAKPARAIISDDEMGIDRARKSAANHAIDQFEQNLLKALEEV